MIWHNFITKPKQVRAKLFAEGDQDGFVAAEHGENAPYIRTRNGRKIAAFGTHYWVVDGDYADLIPIAEFEQQYESLDQ